MLGRLAVSLLTGSSIGATLMYLFDPDHGPQHRKRVSRAAAAAYDTTADSAASAWESARYTAADLRDRAADLRDRAAMRMAAAYDDVVPPVPAPARFDHYGYDDADLAPSQSFAAMALARRSRDLVGEARDAYARARDMYYDALIDLELARARYRRESPKKLKAKDRPLHTMVAPASRVRPSPLRRKVEVEPKTDYVTVAMVAAGCCALGAAAMFLLDPTAGRRRRALIRDKSYSVAKRTGSSVGGAVTRATRYATDYGQGKVAEAKHVFRTEDVPDEKLVARIRSEMGRVVSHPSSVHVAAVNGIVTLRGPVLASEFDALMKCVYNVVGVREVINQVETHATAGHVPGLQG